MYIEMTTFAIPTVIIKGLLFAALVIGGWCLLSAIGITIYWWLEGRSLKEKK